MMSFWSWFFTSHVLIFHTTWALSSDELVYPQEGVEDPSKTTFNGTVNAAVTVSGKSKKLVAPIVGGVLGGLALLSIVALCIYISIRRRSSAQLEEGMDSDQNGRQWFSRFERFRRDKPSLDLEGPLPDHIEKPSAIPRYLRPFSRKRAGVINVSIDRPLPPAPAHPKSARLLPGNNSAIVMSLPSLSPNKPSEFAFSDSLPSVDRVSRRKIQVAPQPVVLGHPFPEPLEPKSRRRPNFPNLFQLNSKGQPVPPEMAQATPEEIVRKMQEKLDTITELEEKSRFHFHHIHSQSIDRGEPLTCQIDQKYEQDISELRREVRYLEELLPNNRAAPKVALSSKW